MTPPHRSEDRRPPRGGGSSPRTSNALGRREYLQACRSDRVDNAHFEHGPDRLYLIEIALTYDCQCRCEHCALGHQPRTGALLDADEIVTLCRQAHDDLGARVVELFGGEPLLRPDLVSLVRRCGEHLQVWISSNGLGLTRPLARQLADAGLAQLILSLDSTDPAEHDRIRGVEGSHAAVMRALDLCAEVGITTHLSACVTPELLRRGEVDRLIDFTRRSAAAKICLLPAKMAGRFGDREDVLLSERELHALWKRTFSWRGLAYVEAEENYSRNISKCFCLRDWIYVNPYGIVQPCVYVFFDFGDVRTEDLKTIYRRMHEHEIFRDRRLLNRCLMQNPEFVQQHFGDRDAAAQLIKVR